MPPLLPRWLAGEAEGALAGTYFVTWHLRIPHRKLSPAERGVICSALRHGDGDRYVLRAYVVMDDHVHVLVEANRLPIDRVVYSWKSFTAHELQRRFGRLGSIWQEGDLVVRVATAEVLRSSTEYLVGNPWKRWPFLTGYPWVWEADDDAGHRR